MTDTETTAKALTDLENAIAALQAAGYDADEIIDTVGAMVGLS